MDNRSLAQELQTMLTSGMTMEDALAAIMKKAVPVATSGVDRIEMARNMKTIEEVKDALHRAAAKKSKSKGKAAEEKYDREIAALKERLAELRSQVTGSDDPIRTAMELGKTDKALVTDFLKIQKPIIEEKIQSIKAAKNLSNIFIKGEIGKQETIVPESVQKILIAYRPELLREYERQMTVFNQWAINYIKQVRFVELMEQGGKEAEEAIKKAEEKKAAKDAKEARREAAATK